MLILLKRLLLVQLSLVRLIIVILSSLYEAGLMNVIAYKLDHLIIALYLITSSGGIPMLTKVHDLTCQRH